MLERIDRLVPEALRFLSGCGKRKPAASNDEVLDIIEERIRRFGSFGEPCPPVRPPAASRTDAGMRSQSRYRLITSMASSKVEVSGAVNPDPMTSKGSPMTSDNSRLTTVAGYASAAN